MFCLFNMLEYVDGCANHCVQHAHVHKYLYMYLIIVLKELETTSTYEKVNVCCEEVFQKHFEYMSSDIKV